LTSAVKNPTLQYLTPEPMPREEHQSVRVDTTSESESQGTSAPPVYRSLLGRLGGQARQGLGFGGHCLIQSREGNNKISGNLSCKYFLNLHFCSHGLWMLLLMSAAVLFYIHFDVVSLST
jgi:hypothetical protein